jgi:hypothetical protein
MTTQKVAEQKAEAYIKAGMDYDTAIKRATQEAMSGQVGMGDFAEGWDTFTTYAPWIAGAVAAWWLYTKAKKAKAGATSYIQKTSRKAKAAMSAWSSTSN